MNKPAKGKKPRATKRTTKRERDLAYRDLANLLLGLYLAPYLRKALVN